MSATPFTPVEQIQARRGAEVLLDILASEGVQYIFGNPGTTELPLMDALLRTPDIHYVLALQEASAVAMADGYAQAAGRPGFLNLHTAGGLGHGMGNLINAHVSQTPLVVTAGQQDLRHTVSDPLLFDNLVRIAVPAVKWAQEVTRPEQLPILVRRAFHDANAAPSGPVFLSLPMDVMDAMTDTPSGRPSFIDRQTVAGSLPTLAQYLADIPAGRLAIIAGDEIHSANAAADVVAMAEMLGAPVYGSSWPSRIPFPTSHPQWRGNLPTTAQKIAEVLSDYDAIFALGGKSLITILYSEGQAVPQGCEVYQLSADIGDLGRTFPTRLSMEGHIGASLRALLPWLEQACAPVRDTFEREGLKLARQRSEHRAAIAALAEKQSTEAVISPLVAAREAMRAIGPHTPIVDEAIATSKHVREFLNSDSPKQYSFLRGGALGWGMPAAIGCSLGIGREPVACLVGDGAAMYSPQSLWTAAHEKLPVTFIVMNNREYNVLKNFMRSQHDYVSAQTGKFIAMQLDEPAIDYVKMAESLGVPARRVDQASDIAPAIAAGLTSGGPNLIEVMIRPE